MSKLYPVIQYGWHWLHKVNEHSLHSPFLYSLYKECIKADEDSGFEAIIKLRQSLLKDQRLIEVEDLGAGSRIDNDNQRRLASIAKYATTPARFSRLLSRLIRRFECKTVLELGTSLGLNSLYMALPNPDCHIYSLEGSKAVATEANDHFSALEANNISLTIGNIDQTLVPLLDRIPKLDLAYMDANHRYEPTLRYFDQLLSKLHDQSLVVVDDIHWSAEMNKAWKDLCAKPQVTLSLDLFEAGILFFDPSLQRAQYILDF